MDRFRAKRRNMLAIGLAIAPMLTSHGAEAATKYYVGATTGFWSTASSWSNTSGGVSGAPVPAAGDLVYITNATGLTQSITYNVSGGGVSLGSLTLDATGGSGTGNDTLLMAANMLTVAGPVTVGNNGTGTINQSGGATTATLLYFGYNGGSGSYILSGGTLNATGIDSAGNSEYVGCNAGTGSVNQIGGTHTVTGNLVVGNMQTSIGVYTLNGATAKLNVLGNEYVAYTASGSGSTGGYFYQSAGMQIINGTFSLGENSPASGFFSLTGGTFAAGASSTAYTAGETLGDVGYGDFYQAGGTNTIGTAASGQILTVGNYGTAEYDMAVAGITLTVNGNEYIGRNYDGSGTFYQVAGTHTVTNFLSIGDANGSSGTFDLSAGTLSVGASSTVPANAVYSNYEIIGAGGVGTFAQTGGTNIVGSAAANQQLEIGYGVYDTGGTGTYTMSGSASVLTVYGSELVGDRATGNANVSGGTFIQYAGTHNVSGGLYVGSGSGSTGYFGLVSGTLYAYQEFIASGGGGYGDLEQTGGTNTIPSTGTLPGLFIGSTAGDYGIYSVNGSGAVLTAYDLVVGGTPTAAGGTGVLNIESGTVTASLGLKIWNTANSYVVFSGGNLTVGSLNTSGNSSNFEWTGGTLTIQSAITIDANFALGQSVALNTGMVLVANGSVTNNGEITLAGGTLNSSGSIVNNSLIQGYGTIISTGGFTNNLQITQGNGTITITTTGAISNAGTINLATGHILALGSSALTNTGTVGLNGASITGVGTFTNSIGGIVTGPGLINTAAFSNIGVLEPLPGTLNIIPAWTNNGVVELAGITSTITGGAITNNSTIQGFGNIGSSIANNGTIEAANGGTLVVGTLTNPVAGILKASTGNKLLVVSGLAANAGLISLTGGTFDNGGVAMLNTGQITGYGTLSTGGLTNAARFTLSGTSSAATTTITGNVTNNVGQLITIQTQPAIFTGNIVNNGTIQTISTTVTFAGSYTGNSYISDPSVNNFDANVTIVSGGIMTGGTGDKFVFLAGTVTNNGSFANAGTLVSGDNITSGGTFNQSGPQTWYPGETFTNTAGVAIFATDAGAGGQNLTVNVSGGMVTFAASQHLANLNVSTEGIAKVTGGSAGGRSVLFTPSLSIAGTLDLTTDVLDIQNGGSAGLAAVATLLQRGYNNGTWTGTGITSSSVATDSTHLTAIGVILNTTPGNGALYTSFDGATVAVNDVLARDTYYGDANLDGKVDGSDYTRIDNGYLTQASGWYNGDFNYDGIVNGSDYTLIDNAFNTQGAQISSEIASPTAQIADSSAVPEPGCGVLLVSAIGAISRHRKKR